MTTITFPTLRATVQVDERHRFEPGAVYEVRARVSDGVATFYLYPHRASDLLPIAESTSAQAISKLVFDRGAAAVHHLYDLKLAEGR